MPSSRHSEITRCALRITRIPASGVPEHARFYRLLILLVRQFCSCIRDMATFAVVTAVDSIVVSTSPPHKYHLRVPVSWTRRSDPRAPWIILSFFPSLYSLSCSLLHSFSSEHRYASVHVWWNRPIARVKSEPTRRTPFHFRLRANRFVLIDRSSIWSVTIANEMFLFCAPYRSTVPLDYRIFGLRDQRPFSHHPS